MREDYIKTQILSDMEELRKLEKSIDNFSTSIRVHARFLLGELKNIDGWEAMIEHCRPHYEESTKKGYDFFDWCSVYWENDCVYFLKGYSSGEEYTVLTIKLNEPLEKQVKDAQERVLTEKKEKEEESRKRELAELKRLKEKYEL